MRQALGRRGCRPDRRSAAPCTWKPWLLTRRSTELERDVSSGPEVGVRGEGATVKRLRVYLSSTFEDLKEYRAAVFAALEKGGLDVARMEGYTAADERPLELCLRDVAQSDIYVGVFAWRYGYEPPVQQGNPEGRSITELEYRQAESSKLRKLLFFAHPDTRAAWPDRCKDEVTGQGERGEKLNRLRSELSTE